MNIRVRLGPTVCLNPGKNVAKPGQQSQSWLQKHLENFCVFDVKIYNIYVYRKLNFLALAEIRAMVASFSWPHAFLNPRCFTFCQFY